MNHKAIFQGEIQSDWLNIYLKGQIALKIVLDSDIFTQKVYDDCWNLFYTEHLSCQIQVM